MIKRPWLILQRSRKLVREYKKVKESSSPSAVQLLLFSLDRQNKSCSPVARITQKLRQNLGDRRSDGPEYRDRPALAW
jgi:hypothetical protein